MIKPFLLFAFSLVGSQSWGAACCGGGFAAPSLIVGDDRAVLTGSFLQSQISDEIYADGLWKKRNFREDFESLRIEGARVFRDRWQGGFSLPLIKRTRSGQSSSGAGDLALTAGYEVLPDWDYNPYRPKGTVFLQLTAPTGRSIFEAKTDNQIDARGRGFWALGAGSLMTKSWGDYDLFGSIEVHRSFRKDNIHPGFGANFGGGGGYSLGDLRLGVSVIWTYEDPVKVTDRSFASEGSSERYATTSLSLSYLYSTEWAGTVAYSDQTWIGEPVNTRLGQSLTLQIQRRWSR